MGKNEELVCQIPHTPKLNIELPCHLAAPLEHYIQA